MGNRPVPKLEAAQVGKKTVVIVDDFAPFRRLLRSKLEVNGLQTVAEASDGLEAVAKAAELQPDLVLLDIGLPKLNGIKAAAQIHSIAPQSKILFVSLDSAPEIVRSLLRDGAWGYVRKSEINRELENAIEAVLQGERFVSAGFCLAEA